MPTVLALIVLIAVFYAFWLFVQTATPYQTGRLLGVMALMLGLLALAYLALTGRLPWALLVLIALWPVMAGYFDRKRRAILERQRILSDHDGLKDQVKNDFDSTAGKDN